MTIIESSCNENCQISARCSVIFDRIRNRSKSWSACWSNFRCDSRYCLVRRFAGIRRYNYNCHTELSVCKHNSANLGASVGCPRSDLNPIIAIIGGVIGGIILGLIFAAAHNKYMRNQSLPKRGLVFGIILFLIDLALNSGSSYGTSYFAVSFGVSLVSSLIFGYLLGYFFMRFTGSKQLPTDYSPPPPPSMQ